MTDTIKIDANRALELVQQAVQGKENSTYFDLVGSRNMSRRYVVNDQPACLIGVALTHADLTVDELLSMEGSGIRLAWNRVFRLDLTNGAIEVFVTAQCVQDACETWGTALKNARRTHNRLRKEGIV